MAKFDLNPNLKLSDVAQYIGDVTQAKAAYAELRRLQAADLVSGYLPAGWVAAHHRQFNVWVSRHVTPPADGSSGERVTLEVWCARWIAGSAGAREIMAAEGGAA